MKFEDLKIMAEFTIPTGSLIGTDAVWIKTERDRCSIKPSPEHTTVGSGRYTILKTQEVEPCLIIE